MYLNLLLLLNLGFLSHAQLKVDALQTLVEINSGTKNTEGVSQVQAWFSSQLKTLGFEVENTVVSGTSVVRGRIKKSNDRFVTLITHADTVFEKSSPFQKFSMDGQWATGPGIIDAKGGMIVMLNGLRGFLTANPDSGLSIQVISSPSEELGSPGLQSIYRELADQSWLVLGFEPGLDDGSIVESRRGNKWYKIQVLGKEAHAGRNPEEGVNACWELSRIVDELMKLNGKIKGTSVSVGRIEGGQDKFNVVCGEASAKVDTRFGDAESALKLSASIEAILKKAQVPTQSKEGLPQLRVEVADESMPFSATSKSRAIVEKYLKSLTSTSSFQVHATISKGTADTNYFGSYPDLVIVDGLGPYGGGLHTPNEKLFVPSLESRAKALTKFLSEIRSLRTPNAIME